MPVKGKASLKQLTNNLITERWRGTRRPTIIPCGYCTMLLCKVTPRHTYCNNKCKKAAWRQRAVGALVSRACKNCSKDFLPKRSDASFCSSKCRNALYRKKLGKPVLGEHRQNCKECAILFTRTEAAQKYCSYRCFLLSRIRSRKLNHRRLRRSKLPLYEADKIQGAPSEPNPADWEARAKESMSKILQKYGRSPQIDAK